jgi:hypothetical protein
MPALRRSRPPLPRFAVAWFPKLEGLERIEAFRRKHDPAAALIPAHLSLVFPFPTANSRLQVETHVQRVVSLWPPVAVTFSRVRMHANEFLFLMASRGAASITALHDRLYTRSFAPHLRRDLPFEEAGDAIAGEFAAVMREVTLLSVGRDGRIEPLKSFSLHTA